MTQLAGIVIPCYNEAQRLPVAEFRQFLRSEKRFQLVFVNDGSVDQTLTILNQLRDEFPDLVQVFDLKKNAGKAEAVRRGLLHLAITTQLPWLGFWDADLATPLWEIEHLYAETSRLENIQITMGCRLLRLGAEVERKMHRHYLGRVFATFASIALQLPVYDTQCGAKLLRRDVIEKTFTTPFVTRWLFDVEILFRMKRMNGGHTVRALEVPLRRWVEFGQSKVKFSDMLKAPFELARIWWLYR